MDDTAARHARKDGFTTQIGDDRFAVFRTGASKSREAFLSVLRAGHSDYVVNAAALEYMREYSLTGQVVAQLDAHPAKRFADTSAWSAHLARLGIDTLAITPDPVQIATEGALWGAICDQGLLAGTVAASPVPGRMAAMADAAATLSAEPPRRATPGSQRAALRSSPAARPPQPAEPHCPSAAAAPRRPGGRQPLAARQARAPPAMMHPATSCKR